MNWFLSLFFMYFATPAHSAFAELASRASWKTSILLGGATTYVSENPTVQAFRNPIANMPPDRMELHLRGDRLFDKKFSDDPSRPDYGLGPVYNHLSCVGCHIQDGRGALPMVPAGNPWTRLGNGSQVFLRISVEDGRKRAVTAPDRWGAPVPVPGFSDQLFHLGSFQLRGDDPGAGQAQVWMRYEFRDFVYADGRRVELRRPVFEIRNPYDLRADGGSRLFEPDVRTGPRMTPPMIGLGLIEAIRSADILKLARRDLTAWGISGRPNWVFDRRKELQGSRLPVSLGRFGLKANSPSVYHQSLAALNGDMGVTNSAFPEESIAGTPLFESFKPHWKAGVEASDEISDALVFYAQTLAVPSRRAVNDPLVSRGAKLFQTAGCIHCHQPTFRTGEHEIKALSRQLIHPFSDFLLHDMGDGLADGRADFRASGREWKTRPLWGVGLTQVINPRAGYLHDGRARTLEEAVLWHGGESERSRKIFSNFDAGDRASLIQFLKSL